MIVKAPYDQQAIKLMLEGNSQETSPIVHVITAMVIGIVVVAVVLTD